MTALRDFIDGPWRAVPVLGVTQILSWGTIFYTPVLIVPLIAAERGWSISFAMGGFSVGLLAAGLDRALRRTFDRPLRRPCGDDHRLADRRARAWCSSATPIDRVAYLAVWMVLGVAMAANLYDSAFATLGRIFGAGARRPITALTLAGGFASTVSWPATHFLLEAVGWRGTYLVYAALLACISAPLHALALPRCRFEAAALSRRATRRRRRHGAAAARTCRSFWWPRPSRPMPSFRPACPRICWRSSRAPASMPERWSGSARCSGRRRSARG